jgi:hypothetical protein
MVNRDPRYLLVLSMYEKGHVKSLNDIFIFIPKTRVSKDLGMKVGRFNKLMLKVEHFTLKDIVQIGSFCEVSLEIMLELWIKEYRKQREKEPVRPSRQGI